MKKLATILLLLAILLGGCENSQTVAEGYWPEGDVPVDTDGDGITDDKDCDPGDGAVGGQEVCDGLDNDCDGQIDEEGGDVYYLDNDGDGYGDKDAHQACESLWPDEAVVVSGDCDDSKPSFNPGAMVEACDLDQNCDGAVTSCLIVDDDGDGWTENDGDCDDGDKTVYPSATEVVDGKDNDCDGLVD